MLGVVGSAVAATCFLPAVLIKGVLEEQEEGLTEQSWANLLFPLRLAAHMLCFIKDNCSTD